MLTGLSVCSHSSGSVKAVLRWFIDLNANVNMQTCSQSKCKHADC